MKHFYAIFFFFFAVLGISAQDAVLSDRSGGASFEFKIYPNPVTDGIVNIQTDDFARKQVHIYNVFGIEVLSEDLRDNKVLDISGLDKGVYILRIVNQNKVATRKLIIK